MSSSTDQHKGKKNHLNQKNTGEEKDLTDLTRLNSDIRNMMKHLKLRPALDIFKDFNTVKSNLLMFHVFNEQKALKLVL